MSALTEIEGIEYCSVHRGVLVEGSDPVCQYEERGGDEPCNGVALYWVPVVEPVEDEFGETEDLSELP